MAAEPKPQPPAELLQQQLLAGSAPPGAAQVLRHQAVEEQAKPQPLAGSEPQPEAPLQPEQPEPAAAHAVRRAQLARSPRLPA